MSPRERAIRRSANEVLDEVGLTGSPIDPALVAQEKGLRIEILPGFPDDVYGALYFDGSAFGIVVSSSCFGDGHRNFTIGHELGHYHIDGHAEAMFAGRPGQILSRGGHFRQRNDAHEREADWFASELLMPERWARPLARLSPPTVATIRGLAADFGVSLTCAAVRYAELTDQATAVVVSREGQVEWVAFSERFREHGWSRRAWKRELVPRHTPTFRLGRAGTRVHGGEEDGGTCLLCTWFEGAPEMVAVDEEAVGLGAYGRVITILSADKLPTVDELATERDDHDWRERDWRDAIRGYELD
jgi:hypothetical protein